MNILINASNLKKGGGLQVADSVCHLLNRFSQHRFVVVLSDYFPRKTLEEVGAYANVQAFTYNVKNNFQTLAFGRDAFLDGLVRKHHIQIVLTIFGPSRWNPRCEHLSGYAISHLTFPKSPYFKRLNLKEKLQTSFKNFLWKTYFKRSTRYFFTENPMVSERVGKMFKGSEVFTVTNYYNQVFDEPERWVEHPLPKFDGITLLNVSTPYPHKNLGIAIDILRAMACKHPDLQLRFVYTINEHDLPQIPEDLRKHFLLIGKVNVDECPSLYQQCDIAFQPTLLECFTASYPEAMRMERPIVTTTLPFARALCDEAAVYYSPLDAEEAAERIYEVTTNKILWAKLVEEGAKRLKQFDTYEERAEKLIALCEKIVERG